MHESIRFNYEFINKDSEYTYDSKEINVHKESKDGLNCSEVCEAFVDFMVASGFSEQNIYGFFNEG